MNFFVRAKHWQVFMLLIGIPSIAQTIILALLIPASLHGGTHSLIIVLKWIPIPMLFCFTFYLLWLYTIGTMLYAMAPSSATVKLWAFKICLTVLLLYGICFSVFIYLVVSSIFLNALSPPNIIIAPLLMLFIHLLAMLSVIYCCYFIAKILKLAESQSDVRFTDCIGDFVLMIILPIGIWVIQPRINKLFTQYRT